MKLFATLFLSAVTTASLFAASIPRCDLNGETKEGKIKLVPGKVEDGMNVVNPSWVPEEIRVYRLSAYAGKPVGAEWTLCKFVFTPEASGNVSLGISGQWGKTDDEKGWLLVSKLSINGTPVGNADMKKVTDRKGTQIPNGFWFSRNPVYVADGGPDGAAGVLVNHDNRLYRFIKVEAGKPVTVEYMAKAAENPHK